MKKPNWKSIAELIGILSIVASLIFLNLQMRQSEKIAMAELFSANTSAQIDLQALLSQYSDVWIRGKSDEPLSPAVAAIFENLIRVVNDYAFFSFASFQQMFGDRVASEDVNMPDFAVFLYENPGALRVWEEREERLIKYRSILNPHIEDFSHWREAIQGYLNKLDQLQSATKTQ